ncbi:RNA-binding protein, putative [Bodo saltans]|uniref:RNA-binding protein, putative n=1 Tax=Bodo saltans TaxID=75058 RepID=A0A0S4JUI9_BODSA|nr:RNA-binding protein, putative [Bodo saltans]|eukprot:CUG93895.1 RNA-binding protein, putative [Bodo saltans]
MSSPPTETCNVYIAGLPTTFDDSQLLDLVCMRCCEQHSVDSIKCVMDPRTKQCRGYGFVLFNDPNLATHAVRVLDGATIQVTNERNEISSSHHLQVRTAHVSAQPTRHDICSRNAANIPTLSKDILGSSGSGNASPVQGAPPPPSYQQTIGVPPSVPLPGPQLAFQPPYAMAGKTLSLSSSGVLTSQHQQHALPSLVVGGGAGSGSGPLLSSNGTSSFRSLNIADESSYGGSSGSPLWSRPATLAAPGPHQNMMQLTTTPGGGYMDGSMSQISMQRPQQLFTSTHSIGTTATAFFVPTAANNTGTPTHIHKVAQPNSSLRDEASVTKPRPDSPPQAFLADSLFTSTMETPLFSAQVASGGAGPSALVTNVNNMSSSQLHSVTRLSAPTSGASTSGGGHASQPAYSTVMRSDAPLHPGASNPTLPHQHVQSQPNQSGLSFSALPATISLVHAAPPNVSPGASLSNVFDQAALRSPPEAAMRSTPGGAIPILTSPIPQQQGASTAIYMQPAQNFTGAPQQPLHTLQQHQHSQMMQYYPSAPFPYNDQQQQQQPQPVFLTPQQLAVLHRHNSAARRRPQNFAPPQSSTPALLPSAYPSHPSPHHHQQFMSHVTSPTYTTTTPLGPSHQQSPHLSSPHGFQNNANSGGYFALVNSPLVQQQQQQQQQQYNHVVTPYNGGVPQLSRAPAFASSGGGQMQQVPTTPLFGQGPAAQVVGGAYPTNIGTGTNSSIGFQ